MATALKRHDEIMKKNVAENNGHVFKTVGDAFCCAFSDARDAIRAALMAQIVIREEPWETPRPLRVRMSIHTGSARERDNDYFGPPVNKVARIESLAHGGQVIMSRVTADLVKDILPDGVTLREMGSHRLKDLANPEDIYQLVHPDLPKDFPPLRSMDVLPNNLPVQTTPLIGREKELKTIEDLFAQKECRLVSLVGPGGMGKTRLSLQVAADLLDENRDGTWFVDLSAVTQPQGVALETAKVLSLHQEPDVDPVELVAKALEDRKILIILDNFEQVTKAYTVVVTWLRRSSGARFIITSREPLNIRGEHAFHVPPLSLPRPGTGAILSQFEATRLFIDRACAGKPDFQVNNDNAPIIAEICSRLDGIPLAIELAAARIRLINPAAIQKRLDTRLKLLTGGPNDMPDRHKTLRACIDWSYDLLTEQDRVVYRHISVFVGGISLKAACTVLDQLLEDEMDVMDALESLVDKSLIFHKSTLNDEPFFGILDTIAEYGRERLRDAGDEEACHERHARYFHALTSKVSDRWNGPDELSLIHSIKRNWENIRKSLIYFIQGDEGYSIIPMVLGLIPYWLMRNEFILCREWIWAALNQCSDPRSDDYGRLTMQLGLLSWTAGNFAEAAQFLEKSATIFKEIGDARGSAYTLLYQCWTDSKTGELDGIVDNCAKLNRFADQTGDRYLYAKSEQLLGNLYLINRGDFHKARIHMVHARDIFGAEGNRIMSAIQINNLGNVEWQTGNLEKAENCYEEAIPVFEEFEHTQYLRYALCNLGQIRLDQKRFDDALGLFERVKNIAVNTSDTPYLSYSFAMIAEAYLGKNDMELAEYCAAEAVDVIRDHGNTLELGIAQRVQGQIFIGKKEYGKALDLLESAKAILTDFEERDEIEKVEVILQQLHGIGE